nr:aminotransferase class IV [Brevundimonas variabilis]
MIDGQPATEADLKYLAVVNYGAYTSFRVEGGGVRGLDLHLERLETSAAELFGERIGEDRLRDLMRIALAGQQDAWLRISLFSPDIWPRTPSAQVRPKVMTTVSPPPPPLASSVRLKVQTYARETAELKHTATLGLIRARRLARAAGFDDALFADADGIISEGATWNIGFLSGDQVVWPQAPMLAGVTQVLIARGLAEVGISQSTGPVRVADLSRFDGAFFCNSSTPACAVAAIGDHVFDTRPDRIERLAQAWRLQPATPV